MSQHEDFEAGDSLLDPTADPVRELRKGYHDRIAGVREMSISVVKAAVGATGEATDALLGHEDASVAAIADSVGRVAQVVADVDSEVLALLALQAPVARDLRIILAARDITQIGDLCMGLCLSLGSRVGVSDVLTPDLREIIGGIGSETVELLRRAEGAWMAMDTDTARHNEVAAKAARESQTRFLASVLRLDSVPVESALDLGMVARVFERLTDHAVEIGGRVLFAVGGRPSSLATPSSEG